MYTLMKTTLADAATLRPIVAQVMNIEDTVYDGPDGSAVRFRGRLFRDSVEAFDLVFEQFKPLGYTPLFRKEGESHLVLAMPGVIEPARTNPGVNIIMFVLTLLSMLLAGGAYGYTGTEPGTLGDWLLLLWNGWPFAASLLAILLAHEFGHYFAARYHRMAVTLPYFVPFPFSLFGTMGAVIMLKAPPVNKRALLDMGIAGPLAGLVVAVPIVILGLATSPVQAIPLGQTGGFEGNSILYVLLKYLVHGQLLPAPTTTDGLPYWLFMLRFYVLGVFNGGGGTDVFLNQVAWAGWAGLLVTGLNLIPAGQLDGGHALYVLIGRRARVLVPIIITVLVGLGFFWNGWWVWAALIFFLGRAHAEPLDQITELNPTRRLLALFALVLFVLVITPIPFTI
ncbi:MAG: site-2 protease family protein [Anaerolineales bacterium]|nr:site-2 protease family protein [Anaerolineales bacterium]